jgi:hypothetical protein
MLPASVIEPPLHTVCGDPALTVAAWLIVIVLIALTDKQGPAPSGSLLVSVRVTDPKKVGSGVKVTVPGAEVGFGSLKTPLPGGINDHVPIVVPPVTLAPDNVTGNGESD